MIQCDELYEIVKKYYGYKIKMLDIDQENLEVKGILYDSFFFDCTTNDRYGRFGSRISFGESYSSVTSYIFKRSSLNSDEKSIIMSLQEVDNFCKLNLPDSFLIKYDCAYKTKQLDFIKWIALLKNMF